MKFLAAVATAMLFAASTVVSKALVVDNPGDVTVCKPLTFTWSGGTPPYAFSLDEDISDSQTVDSHNQLVQFEPQNGTSFTWVFDLSLNFVGDPFVLKVVDGIGESSQSTPFTILDSADHSCFLVEPSKPKMLSTGEVVGICLGILAFLILLLVAWRVYILHARRRLSEKFRDRKNLGIDQNFPLSPVQKQGIIGGSDAHA